MLPANRAFWVKGEDGGEYGPVDLEELREWTRENRAGLGTEVREDEPHSLWRPWQYYPELVALLAEVHVTSPVPGIPGLALAPLWRRALAFSMDIVLSAFLSFPILFTLAILFMPDWVIQSALLSVHPEMAPPEINLHERLIGGLISDGILAFYMAGFHFTHGRTPGKSCLRIQVVNEQGQKPSATQSFLRALVMIVSISLYGLPFIYAFFNPQRRALHDFIAGTYVVDL